MHPPTRSGGLLSVVPNGTYMNYKVIMILSFDLDWIDKFNIEKLTRKIRTQFAKLAYSVYAYI